MLISRLISTIKEKRSPAVVGLDPDINRIPSELFEGKHVASAVLDFNKKIIDACKNNCAAVKPQAAYYEALGIEGLATLKATIHYAKSAGLHVILDAKRGDIPSTAKEYATAYLAQGSEFESDFLTVNPYLGMESIDPFADLSKKYDKAIFALVKTSNPGSLDFQDVQVALTSQQEEKLNALHVSTSNHQTMLCNLVALRLNELALKNTDESGYSSIGAVVGATQTSHMKELRAILPNSFFLVPGYGAQGGTALDLSNCFNEDGLGALVNSSRGILYAYEKSNDPNNFEKHAREALRVMNDEINAVL